MKYRMFGDSDRLVSEVGIGTWQLGGSDWGDITDEQALATLHASADAGVTFIDTADIYGMGRSESLVGRFLHEQPDRERFFVATKLGRHPTPGWPANFTRAAVREHTEASLRRLGLETIDLMQTHCIPRQVMENGEIFHYLEELRAEGKIRAFGASVESMAEALLCLERGVHSLQIIFNIFRQKPIGSLFQRAQERKVALIVRLPLASGLLGGNLTKASVFAPNDHRTYNRDGQAFNVGETFAGLPYERAVDLVNAVRPLVPESMTMAQFALRWCLDFDAVTTVIPGAKRPAHARDNAVASDLPPLARAIHAELLDFYDDEVSAHIRGPY